MGTIHYGGKLTRGRVSRGKSPGGNSVGGIGQGGIYQEELTGKNSAWGIRLGKLAGGILQGENSPRIAFK